MRGHGKLLTGLRVAGFFPPPAKPWLKGAEATKLYGIALFHSLLKLKEEILNDILHKFLLV